MRWLMILLAFTGCSRETPLTRAAATGSISELRQSLRGASLSETQSALIAAVRNGNTAAIPVLIQAGANVTTTNGVNDWTPLEHAVHKRQLKSVQALLDAGAPVNQIDSRRRTALAYAAANGFTEIVDLLLAKGADPRMQDDKGDNALDYAIAGHGSCQADAVKAILAKSPGLKKTCPN